MKWPLTFFYTAGWTHVGCCFTVQLEEDGFPPGSSSRAHLTPNTDLAFRQLRLVKTYIYTHLQDRVVYLHPLCHLALCILSQILQFTKGKCWDQWNMPHHPPSASWIAEGLKQALNNITCQMTASLLLQSICCCSQDWRCTTFTATVCVCGCLCTLCTHFSDCLQLISHQ